MLLSPLPPLANSYEITGWLCGEFLEIAQCRRMTGSLDAPRHIFLRFVRDGDSAIQAGRAYNVSVTPLAR